MSLYPDTAIWLAWVAWMLSWFAAAGWSRRTQRRAGGRRELLHLLVTSAGFLLLFCGRSSPEDPARQTSAFRLLNYDPMQLWSPSPEAGWALVALAVAGFLFCWWARLHLGRLWSGSVTRKEGHRIVDTGPYRLVRHPIYTGLILAAGATALDKGTVLALAGLLLIVLGFTVKARLEEQFLKTELGAETYDAYAARTPMLIPYPVLQRSRD